MNLSVDQIIYKYWNKLKLKREQILRKPLSLFIRFGITADHLSSIGFLSGIISLFYLNHSRGLFLLFWAGNRFFDIIDGPLARISNKKIIIGINVDRIFDFSYYFLLILTSSLSVGIPSIVATFLFVIHILYDKKSIGKRVFAPNNYAQYFFLLGLLDIGIVFQILFTIVSIIYKISKDFRKKS